MKIVWERGDGSTADFAIAGPVMVVGRDETADIRVDEPLVSRFHARVEREGSRVVLIDLGSTNLTRVNGVVVSRQELRPGDELQFARASCRFVADEPAD